MLAALAMVLTMVPQIPTGTGGYVHFGDSVIYLAAMLLGPAGGAVVGAVGHSLADLLSGHAIFILPTFVIKGLMGFVIGKLIYPAENLNKRRFICAGLSALVIVTLGYFVAEIPLYGVQTAAVCVGVFAGSVVNERDCVCGSAADCSKTAYEIWMVKLEAGTVLVPASDCR